MSLSDAVLETLKNDGLVEWQGWETIRNLDKVSIIKGVRVLFNNGEAIISDKAVFQDDSIKSTREMTHGEKIEMDKIATVIKNGLHELGYIVDGELPPELEPEPADPIEWSLEEIPEWLRVWFVKPEHKFGFCHNCYDFSCECGNTRYSELS